MDILGDFQTWYLALSLTSPRILVAFTVLPMFAQRIFPALIRNGVMVMMALAILPLTHEQITGMTINLPFMGFLILKEAALGLMLGYLMSIPFWAMKGAGFLIDMQRGAMSALFYAAPISGMASPLGSLLAQFATALLFVSGGFLVLLDTLMMSYQVWPIPQFIPDFNPDMAKLIVGQLTALLYMTLLIAGPFIGIMFIIDFGAGLVGKYLPQLNIFLAVMPVKTAIVFFILVFYISIMARYMKEQFFAFSQHLTVLDSLLNSAPP